MRKYIKENWLYNVLSILSIDITHITHEYKIEMFVGYCL